MTTPTFTTPPDAPSRSNPTTFRVRMDAFLAWMVTFVSELVTGVTWFNSTATQVAADAATATGAALTALGGAGASVWVSGGSYTAGDVVLSPADGMLPYRALLTHSGETTDPSADATNWGPAIDLPLTGFTNAVQYNKAVSEKAVSVSSSSGTLTIDCSLGNKFSVTLSENITTLTFTNVPASGYVYGFSLEVIQDAGASGYDVSAWGAGGSIRWPESTKPTLTATASARDRFVLETSDGGTSWDAFTAGQAMGVPV